MRMKNVNKIKIEEGQIGEEMVWVVRRMEIE